MKDSNRYKEIYQTIPEGCNRESQNYKSKAAETPESCGRQLRGWFMTGNQGWVNKIRSMLKQVQHGHCVITANAFTLIELLVVVLIIGILAAIAVPQYQKAVLKSRFSAAAAQVRVLEQGLQEFYLANGYYTGDLSKFALETDFYCGGSSYCQLGIQSGLILELLIGYATPTASFYRIDCLANSTKPHLVEICQEYGTDAHKTSGNIKYYTIKKVNQGLATYYGRSIPF